MFCRKERHSFVRPWELVYDMSPETEGLGRRSPGEGRGWPKYSVFWLDGSYTRTYLYRDLQYIRALSWSRLGTTYLIGRGLDFAFDILLLISTISLSKILSLPLSLLLPIEGSCFT